VINTPYKRRLLHLAGIVAESDRCRYEHSPIAYKISGIERQDAEKGSCAHVHHGMLVVRDLGGP